MANFTDFKNGLQDANQYLSAQNSINAQLTGSVADIGRLVVSAEIDFNLKEIICSLMAGRGLLLPNIQICLSLNLKELLKINTIQEVLYDKLQELDQAFDEFLNHLNLDQVLGRINNVLGEITNIANMINFCSAPLDPVQIPNVLENAMESFLGAGMDIINRIGTIIPDEIGGCLIDGEFNCGIYSEGLFKTICENYDDIVAGQLDTIVIESISTQIDDIVTDIGGLIDRENNVVSVYDNGGSELAETPRPTYTGLGTLYNSDDEGIQGATRNGSALWSAYQQLGSYQVVDNDGVVYNNIFELFVDEDLLRILRRTPNPSPEISEQVPIRNYCGEIIGYQKVVTQEDQETSIGTEPGEIDQPGFNAGGLPTNPVTQAQDATASGGGTVINEITNITNIEGGGAIFVDSESAQLLLDVDQGQLVWRTDQGIMYVANGGDTGTMADYDVVGGGSLGEFLTDVNENVGSGILVRNGNTPYYRTITGTPNQITVLNGGGLAGEPTISITANPSIPGTDAMVVPVGTTGQQVSTTNGAFRYNTTTGQFEGYQSGSWQGFATGSSAVNDGINVGGGSFEVYKQNNAGTLEFRTFNVSGAITMNSAADIITVGENLTASNVGSGAGVFESRNSNDFQFRSLVAGNNVSITENANDITINAEMSDFTGSVQTTTNALTEVLFDGLRQTPGANKVWFFEITAVANRDSSSDATAIKIEGLIDNNGGTVTIVGTSGNKTIYNSTAGTANYDLVLDVVGGADFRVQVQGDNAHTVDWTVKYKFIEA